MIFQRLERSNNDWEQVLFSLLLKNFGSKVNSASFLGLADVIDFSVIRKLQQNVFQLESVFFGLIGLLDQKEIDDIYFLALSKEFHYLKRKFALVPGVVPRPDFFKLRPHNFPTIRLSQLAMLYGKRHNLFSETMQADTLEAYYRLYGSEASTYWKTHFTLENYPNKAPKGSLGPLSTCCSSIRYFL